MSLLQGLGAANNILQNATGLVRELKRPRIRQETFEQILIAQINATQPEDNKAAFSERIDEKALILTERFIQLRDSQGNGKLTLEESGMERELFQKVDSNGDGVLSRDEVHAYFSQQLKLARG